MEGGIKDTPFIQNELSQRDKKFGKKQNESWELENVCLCFPSTRDDKTFTFCCLLCPKQFTRAENAKRHYCTKHQKDVEYLFKGEEDRTENFYNLKKRYVRRKRQSSVSESSSQTTTLHEEAELDDNIASSVVESPISSFSSQSSELLSSSGSTSFGSCEVYENSFLEDGNASDPSKIMRQGLEASYKISLEIARNKCCFTQGSMIKQCAIVMAECFELHESVDKFKNVALSRSSVQRRVTDLADNVVDQLKLLLTQCKFCSFCLDESCDNTDVSQLMIFVRMIFDDFSTREEMLEIVPLHKTTKGSDVYEAFVETVDQFGGFDKCSAIVTDGAKAMTGHINGLWGLLRRKHGLICMLIHCLIHQEALCGKALKVKETMRIVVKITNAIRGGHNSLNHRLFKEFLKELESCYGDLRLHCDVRWLSAGRCLEIFFGLREVIPVFLAENVKTKECLEFQEKFLDPLFHSELAFLTDITKHLNVFNSFMQYKNQSVSQLMEHVKNLREALQEFTLELQQNNLSHFPSCREIKEEFPELNFEQYASDLISIENEFQERFKDFDIFKPLLELFIDLLGAVVSNQEENLKSELSALQDDYRFKRRKLYAEELFRLLPEKDYPKLKEFGLRIFSMFGSTYQCESSFSVMNYIKSKESANLTQESFSALMRLSLTEITPDINSLVEAKILKSDNRSSRTSKIQIISEGNSLKC